MLKQIYLIINMIIKIIQLKERCYETRNWSNFPRSSSQF